MADSGLDFDQKVIKLPLRSSSPSNFNIGAVGVYSFTEELLQTTTEGYLVAINSKDQQIPSQVVFFGNYNPFKSGAHGTEKQRLDGYLIDTLDYEDKSFDLVQFAGQIGDFMGYLRCGKNQCDAYYAEILLSQLYVGHLYTINNDREVEDFCP